MSYDHSSTENDEINVIHDDKLILVTITKLLFILYIHGTYSVVTHTHTHSLAIVLRPADTTVARSKTIPLSCVATSNGGSQPIFTWKRRDELTGQISNVGLSPVNQEYQSTDGIDFSISTLILCNMGFGDAGMYICNASGSATQENIRVSVHGRINK